MHQQGEITRFLDALSAGGREALDRLLPLVYEQLHGIAHRRLQNERADHTLVTTDLVHEAYVKVAGLDRIRWESSAQFFAVVARAMRRILVDYAVRRGAQKRGGDREKVALDEVDLAAGQSPADLVALDDALERLASINERQCRVVECRFFVGMNIEETAEALGTSPATVKRDWAFARAWLHRELRG